MRRPRLSCSSAPPGSTLIELLVAIGIVALLVCGSSCPLFSKPGDPLAARSARRISGRSELRRMVMWNFTASCRLFTLAPDFCSRSCRFWNSDMNMIVCTTC